MRTRDKLAIGGKILASRLTGRPRPFFVQYSLLNSCNARCVYCNLPSLPDPTTSLEDHLRALDEFAALGSVRIKFLGGEPLLSPHLERLVRRVDDLGMRSAMVTNGFLIPEKLSLVKQFDELVISLDGSEAAHDRQRGRGTWKRAMRGIEACAAEGLDFFISAVVTRESQDEVDWLIETARRFGVMVNFQVVHIQPAIYPNAEGWKPDSADVRTVLGRILAAKESGAPILFSERSHRRALAWHDYSLERVERPGTISPCTAGRYFVHLEADGSLYPCFQHVGRFPAKNVFRDGVAAAWRATQRHGCVDCYNVWLNENRAIFELQPAVIGNFWKHSLRSHKPQVADGA